MQTPVSAYLHMLMWHMLIWYISRSISELHCIHVATLHIFRQRHYGARVQAVHRGIGILHLLNSVDSKQKAKRLPATSQSLEPSCILLTVDLQALCCAQVYIQIVACIIDA
jgi:hypothetical protein